MLTVALHFETGYLAFVPLVVWPFLVPSDLWRRLGRAVALGFAALLASAWVIWPVIDQSHWAARNQVLEHTGLENGYGARQMLSWLIHGQLYDAGRFPIITILVGVGIVVCLWRWRASVAGRALVTIWVVSLLMSFGRTTFGALYDIIPGSTDVFIRRFQMGVQLSGILLAGIAVAFVGRLLLTSAMRLLPERDRGFVSPPLGQGLVAGLSIVALLLLLAPAWTNMDDYDAHNATNVSLQTDADGQLDPHLNELLDYVKAHPQGRVYAGAPNNWGNDFTVGAVPVFKYLESKDVDEVGYTLRTASLMTDPEYYFDDTNPGDYPLFGIGYIITPQSMSSPVPADQVLCSGPYCLWSLPDAGYIHVFDTTGVLAATRANVGAQSSTLLDSPLLEEERDLTVAFNGADASQPTAPGGAVARLAGPRGRSGRRPGERHGPGRGAHQPAGHGRPQRVLRPGMARHCRRAPRSDLHGGARARRRRRRSRSAHGRLHLRRVWLLRAGSWCWRWPSSWSSPLRHWRGDAGDPRSGPVRVGAHNPRTHGTATAANPRHPQECRPAARSRTEWVPVASTPDSTPGDAGRPEPADIAVGFLQALARFDIDAALEVVDDDLVYANVTLPTVYGKDRFERAARAMLRPDRMGFNVHFNHVATEGDIVLTDRIDELNFRRFATRFWVYGRFVVTDGKIRLWRDAFDWLDVTIGNLRGLAGLVSPSLNRQMPRE